MEAGGGPSMSKSYSVPPRINGNRVAVLCGVSEVPNGKNLFPKLSCVSDEIEDLKKLLTTELNESLRFQLYNETVYREDDITREKLLKLLEELQKYRNTEIIFLYLAGHGHQFLDQTYFLTYDSWPPQVQPGLPLSDLRYYLDKIQESCPIIVVLDFCYSGAISFNDLNRLSILTSSQDNQVANAGGNDDAGGNSNSFTRWLIEAIKDTKPNQEGYVIWEQIVDNARIKHSDSNVALPKYRGGTIGNFQFDCRPAEQQAGSNPVEKIGQASLSNSIDNSYYIERPPIEENCYNAIQKTAALLRVKGPKKVGKSLLMERILAYGRANNFKTLIVSFDLASNDQLDNLDKLLTWFCLSVTSSLNLTNKITDYWSPLLGSMSSSTNYFQKYVLENCDSPVILGLDKVDLVFEHPSISNDFCRLLRGWNDLGKRGDGIGEIWGKLRLIILHSTEVYANLDINSSPLAGVGWPEQLPDFSFDQVQNLVQNYGFTWTNIEIDQFTSLVGGHPYFITQGLEYIKHNSTLENFLQLASTPAGPFSNHLLEQLKILQGNRDLANAYARVLINNNQPVFLEPQYIHKLYGMGLITKQGDNCISRCKLYSQYFSRHL